MHGILKAVVHSKTSADAFFFRRSQTSSFKRRIMKKGRLEKWVRSVISKVLPLLHFFGSWNIHTLSTAINAILRYCAMQYIQKELIHRELLKTQ